MCKKLIILCVALVVVGLSVPALAVYIGFDLNNNVGNPLKVDLTYAPDPQQPKYGWQNWGFQRAWTGPIAATFANPLYEKSWELPTAELDVHEQNQSPPSSGGLSRNRSGGFAGVTGANAGYGPGAAQYGYGTSYVKLTLDHLQPDTNYRVYLWSFEATNVWSVNSANPDSKYVVWSCHNPKEWLNANGYAGDGGLNGEPGMGGYGPKWVTGAPATTDSNMPAGLAALVFTPTETCTGAERTSLLAPINDNNNLIGTTLGRTTIACCYTNSDGVLVLYGWLDGTDWSGSMHLPLNGFMVVPEPATVALLGLGGLALIRRRKRT